MNYSVANLAKILKGKVVGNQNIMVERLSKIEEAQDGDITFLSNSKYLPWLHKTKASVVIIDKDLEFENPKTNLILVDNSYLAFNTLLRKFSENKVKYTGINENSSIDESSKLGNKVSVGRFSVIDADCKIGNEVVIMDNVTIQRNVKIGANSIIYPGVRIYEDSVIGENCILHSNCVIGSDGFGYAPDKNGKYIKTPQLGNVIIADNVEIGSNSSIDRATLGSTLISRGVKIDNLVQIAHNVSIGEDTVIAGQCGIAGSTQVGSNCQIGGQVGIIGHLKIGNNVRINGKSAVFGNIKDNSVLKGSPAIEERNFNRSYIYFKNLEKLAKDINKLKKLNDSNDKI